ncbi:MAG: hypothetical protein GY795_22355 [Desulfobacterales bacterium]|nr:hypothetical protein [Desulfobacterales bacterium]
MEQTFQNQATDDQIAVQRALILREERKKILAMMPEHALDTILDWPHPAALVHSFPDEDFFFLMHDVGVDDSLELLSLASDRQWEYILDVEIWEKDRIGINSVTKWLTLLLKADPDRFIRWFLREKTEFIEFYLFNNMEVAIRAHDQDPSDIGGNFNTIDDIFYVRFVDYPYDCELKNKDQRDAFLAEFLNRLAAYDFVTYQKVLLELHAFISGEAEEQAYRMRNIRLAEKGFMSFDEAVGIYQPVKPKDIKIGGLKYIAKNRDRDFLPVPLYPAEVLEDDNLFTTSLKLIEIDDILQQLQTEFAGLCNQIISADQKTIREKEELQSIVKKACGYISIGLERLTKKPLDQNRTAALIQKFPLSRIFRVGYGLALELKWRAEEWRKKSWSEQKGLPLTFWGEEWLGVIGGLLIKRPMCYDNFKTGVLYRDFACFDDITYAENILNEITAFDNLLSMMEIQPEIPSFPGGLLTHKSLVLTLWARHYLGLPDDIRPIELDKFKELFDDLWTSEETPRKINTSVKESFLKWLSGKTSMDAWEIGQKMGQALENLFNEIENEYKEVSTNDLDPKYIYLFLIQKPGKSES